MRKLFLLPFIFFLTAPIQASETAFYLVLGFSRNKVAGATHSSVKIPMASLEQCEAQGALAMARNTNEVNTRYWCIEGIK
tara:strand:- start:444 stop:683 length:240 start_codon:yes stop_codon:yes gene_type:complete